MRLISRQKFGIRLMKTRLCQFYFVTGHNRNLKEIHNRSSAGLSRSTIDCKNEIA